LKDDGQKKESNVKSENYNVIESFTQLFATPATCVDDSIYGYNLYKCLDVGYTVLPELTIVFWVYNLGLNYSLLRSNTTGEP
jgi:hypothetical protein